MSRPPPLTVPTEKTFSTFTKDQGVEYAKVRPVYHADLYRTLVEHHTSTGGELGTVLDVGCGPGTATCDLAKYFAHAIGVDPSDGMVNTARDVRATSRTGEPVRFEMATAEDLGSHLSPPIEKGSVDLITAATAAHWFNMSSFWPRAAEILKPGGTVAFWASIESQLHPSIPRAALIQAELDELSDREMSPYAEPGNLLIKGLYVDLELPWTLPTPVAEFDQATFSRKEWGPETSDKYYAGDFDGRSMLSLNTVEQMISTKSLIQRWRKAHPDAVGTDRDFVKMHRSIIERHLRRAGVEEGQEAIKYSSKSVLIIVKKDSSMG